MTGHDELSRRQGSPSRCKLTSSNAAYLNCLLVDADAVLARPSQLLELL
jgi:hypothetical protein